MYNYVNITVQRTFKLHLVLILVSYPNCQGTMKTLLQWQQLLLKYMYLVVMFLINSSLDESCLPTTDEWLFRYSICLEDVLQSLYGEGCLVDLALDTISYQIW